MLHNYIKNSTFLKLSSIIFAVFALQTPAISVGKNGSLNLFSNNCSSIPITSIQCINSAKEHVSKERDTNKANVYNYPRHTKLFSKIENQSILKGSKFRKIYLNNYLLTKESGQNVVWTSSVDCRIHISINSSGIATVEPYDSNWTGSDTIIFKAKYDNLEDEQKVAFSVENAGILNFVPLKPVRKVLNRGVNDILNLVSIPFRWDSTDFIKVPILLLSTYSFMIEDNSIHDWVSNNGRAKKNFLMDFGTQYGQVSFTQLSSLAVLSYGLIFKNDDAAVMGLEIFESYFIANNITSIIKRTFGRKRPYENKGPYNFNFFPSRPNPVNSFPSGHVTLAFSLSSILAGHTDSIWLKSLFYSAAGITAISRVYYSYHWFSDVFMGSAIGFFVGNYLIEMHKSNSAGNIQFNFDEYGRFSLKINF
jgi:membrane-associated phospholipid phosphatase